MEGLFLVGCLTAISGICLYLYMNEVKEENTEEENYESIN